MVLKASKGTHLKNFFITRQYGSTAAASFKSVTFTGTAPTENYAFLDTIPSGITSVKYSFNVIAYIYFGKRTSDTLSATQDFTVTVVDGDITTKSVTMENQWSPNRLNFWGLNLAAPVDSTTAKTQAYDIDFVFGHLLFSEGVAFIGGPNSLAAEKIYTMHGGLYNWSVKNKTLFKLTTITPAEFNLCANDKLILNATATGVINDACKNLAKDNVIAFITAGGKKGLMLIKGDPTGSEDDLLPGEVKFDIKWQK